MSEGPDRWSPCPEGLRYGRALTLSFQLCRQDDRADPPTSLGLATLDWNGSSPLVGLHPTDAVWIGAVCEPGMSGILLSQARRGPAWITIRPRGGGALEVLAPPAGKGGFRYGDVEAFGFSIDGVRVEVSVEPADAFLRLTGEPASRADEAAGYGGWRLP